MAVARSTRRPVGVVLVEPHTMLRAALRHLLKTIDDLELVAEAGSPDDGLEAVRSVSPGDGTVVVVSLESDAPAESFHLIRTVREEFPAAPILVTANRGDSSIIWRTLLAGADSFVPQTRGVSALLDAIRRTSQGEMVITRSDRVSADGATEQADNGVRPLLTKREMQVLMVAAEGLTARQIAKELGVTERTATTHLGHIYRKLGVSNRVAAVAAATRAGLLLDGRSRERAETVA